MNFWFLLIALGLAFILQYLFAMIQLKDFNKHYKLLRKKGRVAIGRYKGAIKAGAIVMLAIDEKGIILEGAYMSGVTILAKFKKIDKLNGKDLANISEKDFNNVPKQILNAIMDASSNYKRVINGEKIESPKSPIGKIGVAAKKFVTEK